MQRQDRAVTLFLLLAFAAWVLVVSLVPISTIAYFVSDDAYYYFQVARNIAAGVGSTFDGFNLSNGYHPLWMIVVLPIYFVFDGSPEVALRVVIGLQGLLGIATARLIWLALSDQESPYFRPFMGILAFLGLASPIIILFNGLETGLVMFLTMILIIADQKLGLLDESSSNRERIVLGLLLGLIVLARLDSAFVLIALAAWKIAVKPAPMAVWDRLVGLARLYWPTMVVFGLLLSPYFVWNMAYFGHLTPISGTLKSSFPSIHLPPELAGQIAPFVLGFAVMSVWVLASLVSPRGTIRKFVMAVRLRERPDSVLFCLWLGCLIHLGWTLGFMSWGVYQWHFGMYVPLLVLWAANAAWVLTKGFERPDVVRVMTVAATVILLVGYSGLLVFEKGSHHTNRLEAAEWAALDTPGDAVFAMADAGAFAYFSGRSTINLDGLINSYEFQDHIVDGSLPDFLASLPVDFVVDAFTPCDYSEWQVPIIARGGDALTNPAYLLRVTPAMESYRSQPKIHHPITEGTEVCFVIWRYAGISPLRYDASAAWMRGDGKSIPGHPRS